MDLITASIVTALAIEVGKESFAEAYIALKNALKKKHGVESDVIKGNTA